MRYGALINTAAIIVGGIAGMLCGSLIKENIKDTVIKGIGVCVLFIGGGGTLSKTFFIENGALGMQGTVMMVVCMALGALFGELIDFEGRIGRFGNWLKIRTGSEKEGGFVDAFVTTSLIVAIGAMGIVGSIEDGLTGNFSILMLKSLIDLITVTFMASALGKGCVFSFIPVLFIEGTMTLLAGLFEPVMTAETLAALSQVGNMLIFIIGLNLIRPGTFRVGNYIPALIFAFVWAAAGLPMT